MFQHIKDLQFDARVSGPDPRFANLLLEQFGGGNGELKAAMQYFCQAFGCRRAYPDKYDLLMDIATEEFSHLEIVGATITMLLDGVNGQMKNAAEGNLVAAMGARSVKKADVIAQAMDNPEFLLETAGGPPVTNARGVPWTGAFVNANGDLTVDLRSNIGAESRAKIVYEYLLQFTDDPHVQETLRFLMTREITHFQQFYAALETIQPNFPPGILQGDVRFTHAAFNMSTPEDARGPWNEGQGPWPQGESWEYIESPQAELEATDGLREREPIGHVRSAREERKKERDLAAQRSAEVSVGSNGRELAWKAARRPAAAKSRRNGR